MTMCRRINIKEIYDVQEIRGVLDQFSNSLNSLSRGNAYRKEMAQKFSVYGRVIILHDIRDKLVGFSAFYCNDTKSRQTYISMIAVDENCKRMGYGEQLISQIVDISKQNQMNKIGLEVNKKNHVAINFYMKMHFSIVKENADSYYMELDIKENE